MQTSRHGKFFEAPGDIRASTMNPPPRAERLAVCSWSLEPSDPRDLVGKALATGIHRVQLALDPLREDPPAWGAVGNLLPEHGVEIVSGMFGCAGEDYTTIDSIRRTGGVAPDATWSQNLRNIGATAEIAGALGLNLVTFHAGFFPHEESDPHFAKMLGRVAAIAELFFARGIRLALETGQETATSLAAFLKKLGCPDVGVNFDPANMILYGSGDPIEAARALGPWVRQVHLKDATRSKTPGRWGEEAPVGAGEVHWPGFFAALRESGFSGNFVIEREAGAQRVADIRVARELFESLTP